jgi:tryptophan synthase alpha chain
MNPFKKEKKQLSIFTTFGFPSSEDFQRQLDQFESYNVDFVEIGIPFSDPLADGPVIQYTSEVALNNGASLSQLFSTLENVKTKLPLVLMGYLNPVLQFGMDHFLERCKATNISGVILPDMSFEIYKRFHRASFEKHQVKPIFLVTPSTPDERIIEISNTCRDSFVYLVSSNATTGKQGGTKYELERFATIKEMCQQTPLFVGFGIKTNEDVRAIQEVVDGAIIGTAFLKALNNSKDATFLREITSSVSEQ